MKYKRNDIVYKVMVHKTKCIPRLIKFTIEGKRIDKKG